MQDTASHFTDDSALDKRCRASVEASMRFFNLDLGMVFIQPETSLFLLISQNLRQTVSVFDLAHLDILQQPSTVEEMLNAIFDDDRRPFVLKDCVSVLASLDAQARACILAQAVAGVVVLVHKLSLLESEITPGVLAREMTLFSRSQERENVLSRIEHSELFHGCLMKRDLVDLILAAVSRSDVHFESPKHTPNFEDYTADGGERFASDMGLKGGFQIMVLN